MPELKLQAGDPLGWWRFLAQNSGMLLGFIIMSLIAVYEEDIGANFWKKLAKTVFFHSNCLQTKCFLNKINKLKIEDKYKVWA